MRKFNKLIALALLTSVISTQVFIGTAFAQTSGTMSPETVGKIPPNTSTLPKISVPADQENQDQQMPPSDYSMPPLKGQVTSIPAGTSFMATVNATVSSNSCQLGDAVTATIVSPVIINGTVVIPEGSQAIGQITYVDPAGRIGKDGSIDLRFTSIKLPNGQKIPLTGKIETVDKSGSLKGGSWKKQVVTGVATGAVATGAGTLAGLSFGALAGVPARLTVFGTALGGFLGLGYVFARKGKDASLPVGATVRVTLDQASSISR